MGGWQEDEGAAYHVAALILHKAVAPGLPLKIHGCSQRASRVFFFSSSYFGVSVFPRQTLRGGGAEETRNKDQGRLQCVLRKYDSRGGKTTLEKGINIKDSQLVKTFKMILIYKQLEKQHLVKHLMIQS